MPRGLLITGTAARTGKTMLGCALAFAFKVRGMRAGVMKPIALGCIEMGGELVSADGAALLASASSDLPIELVSPCRYGESSSPSDSDSAPNFDRIVEAYRELAARSDVVIVEDTGDLAASIDSARDFADLAITLNLTTILVVANQGGFVEAATRAADYGSRRGVSICGFILNALSREASATVQRDAEAVAQRTAIACLGAVRFKEPVSLAIVNHLL